MNIEQEFMRGDHKQRLAQAIMQYGVGNMIDFPDRTLTVAAPETWLVHPQGRENHATEIHDTRFERSLSKHGQKIRRFLAPGTLKYVAFPDWHFCPKCRRLKPLADWEEEVESLGKETVDEKGRRKTPICPKCQRQLVPDRLVTVCENGHMDDFPWIDWVHYCDYKGPRKPCKHPQLVFESGSGTETGEDIRIKCTACGAEANLKGAFAVDAFQQVNKKLGQEIFACHGHRPERGTWEKGCTKIPRTFPRGSSSVHFSFLRTSLVLPSIVDNVRDRIAAGSEKLKSFKQTVEGMKNFNLSESAIKKMVEDSIPDWSKAIAEEMGVSLEMAKQAVKAEFLEEHDEADIDDLRYRLEEYKAMLADPYDVNGCDDEDNSFHKLPEIPISEYDKHLPELNLHLSHVALIDKIGVVRALLGYSRVRPASSRSKEQGFVSIKEPKTDFYPGFKIFGEGIFLEISEDDIKAWLASPAGKMATARVEQWQSQLLKDKADNSYFHSDKLARVTPKFLLLHTLSHLLIRELSFSCGYNIASLAERLYCADKDKDGFNMSGIFIYTASGDAEGTLGGLIRQGQADTLPLIFQRALGKARYCSNDPVCIDSPGQGMDSQNLAACHACALLPETSCEEFNVYLDRGVVIGTFDDPEMGFFSKVTDTRNRHARNNMAKAQVTECVNVEGKSATKGWEVKREELLEDEAIEASKLMENAGVPVPDIIGAELLNGRCNVEMIWQKQKIVYLTSEQMDQASELRKEGWQILDIRQPVDAGIFEL